MKRNIILSLLFTLFFYNAAMAGTETRKADDRIRVIVTSDGEIDDQCSLVRFLLYANEWDIEAIITSSSQYHWHGHKWEGDTWYQPFYDAYAKVWHNLIKHDKRYPTVEELRRKTFLGNVKQEGEMGFVTEGSQRIVEILLDKTDPRPIWIQAWGGTNTIARALKTIEEKYPSEMRRVAEKIRFYFIWEQDNTYQTYIRPHWAHFNIPTIICDQFEAVAYRWRKSQHESMHKFLDADFMNTNILKGHGELCALYPALENGDFRSEGDSPAYFHVIPTGLRSDENPGWGGWGGRFVPVRDNNVWLDPVTEEGYVYPKGRWYGNSGWGRQALRPERKVSRELYLEYFRPTWRWTEPLQNDFAARADWCVKEYKDANHEPVVKCNLLNVVAKPGETLKLSAAGTFDPDGNELTYSWWQYTEAGTCKGRAKINDADKPQASVIIPEKAKEGQTLHIILEVKDSGTPQLTRYARIVVTVSNRSMAQRVADAEMRRFPEAWQTDSASTPKFGYCQGLEVKAFFQLADYMKKQGDEKAAKRYENYAIQYADLFVTEEGDILSYDYVNGRRNLDMINSGKVLFNAYRITGKEKYRKALDLLVSAIGKHPRNSLGGFWHKENYPWQMWLDGLYMCSPFLAQYGKEFNRPDCIDDAVHQCLLVRDHLRDKKTGLYFHAWDEKRQQLWCDPATGLSHHFWGRSIGWWMMAVIDVLDYVPADHPKRKQLVAIVNGLAEAMLKYHDDGCWYQLVDIMDDGRNYREGTVTSMMLYCYTKALAKGYISKRKYSNVPSMIYNGIQKHLFSTDADGTPNITNCCKVAGLGGNPYRDGSYDYYMSEPIRDNDPKAIGPFIMACLMLGK